MKNLIIINALVLTLISLSANARLFGASNFEECMIDGKIGRTEHEMHVLSLKCQKQFPKLVKLYKGKNAIVHCADSNKDNILFFEIIGKTINSPPQKMKIKTMDNGMLYFGGIDPTNSNFETYGSLNTLDGLMMLRNKNKSTNKDNWVDYLSCVEK